MKRYKSLSTDSGFTIVELLIVIVVIAILAAITVVAFNGVQSSAVEASLKSDLRNAATTLENDKALSGGYPTEAGANQGTGFKISDGNRLNYQPSAGVFCVAVTNPKTSKSFYLKTGGQITEGICDVAVTTFAGSAFGFADGSGTSASFRNPWGLAVDQSGVVYVADTNNHRIRKIMPEGQVSVFAGSATAGLADGTGVAAQFNGPAGLDVDAAGNVYVADRLSNRIRKISPAGVVETIAGSTSGTAGTADGAGSVARFNGPSGLTVASDGTIYVADSSNHRIRKITPAGVVSSLAIGQSSFPRDVAIDRDGTIIIADSGNNRIQRMTPSGDVSTITGGLGLVDGNLASARFSNPYGVEVDAFGTIYVADTNNHRIRKITTGGEVSTFAGSTMGAANGTGVTAQLRTPYDVTFDQTGSVMYVTDQYNNRLRKITF